MALRVGLLSAAHLHVWSYVSGFKTNPDAEIVGLWDDEIERGEAFAQKSGVPFVGYLEDLIDRADAVAICSENTKHAKLALAAASKGKHILCEKPLAVSVEDCENMVQAAKAAGVVLMTAFPCRFAPAWERVRERVKNDDIGQIRAICATNHGRCPMGWFVEKDKSGGGALIDHVVHVADLLRDLLGEEPVRVDAQIGNNMYSQEWDDSAMLTIEFPSGIFATLDSSWSRPSSYKTWGDVTLNIVGDRGLIEVDLFGPSVETYHAGEPSYTSAGFGSNADALMVNEFVDACLANRTPRASCFDGMQAAKVAIAAYKSAEKKQPVPIA